MLGILWKVFLGLGILFTVISAVYFFSKNVKGVITDVKAIEKSDLTKLREAEEARESREMFDSLAESEDKVKKARKEKTKDKIKKLTTGNLPKKRFVDEDGFINEENEFEEGFAPVNRARLKEERNGKPNAEPPKMEEQDTGSLYLDETGYLESADKKKLPEETGTEYLSDEEEDKTEYLIPDSNENMPRPDQDDDKTEYLGSVPDNDETSYLSEEETEYLSI